MGNLIFKPISKNATPIISANDITIKNTTDSALNFKFINFLLILITFCNNLNLLKKKIKNLKIFFDINI